MPNQLAWLDALLQGLQRTGLTDQEQLATNGEFDGDGQDNGEAGIDDVLDFSLERLIDGIAALVATRTKPLRRR